MSKTNLALRLPTVETITVEPSCEIATDLSILKEAGFKIIKNSDGSRLICLPTGWTIREHEARYALMDDQEHERGLILKSTLCAHQVLFLRCCFEIATQSVDALFKPLHQVVILNHQYDGRPEDGEIHRVIGSYQNESGLDPELTAECYYNQAEKYLDENFRYWRYPLAYWKE